MQSDRERDLVAYFSPSGNTRKVANIIVDALNQAGQKPVVLDLEARDGQRYKKLAFDKLNQGGCLWVGSPIYAHHALPQVTGFISGLPVIENSYAVPFVTYGGVTSGIGLYEMGKILTEKGFKVIGAGKVLAVHSMMWQSKNPLGQGHPNGKDEAILRDLVKAVQEKTSRPDTVKPLAPDQLNYHSKDNQDKFFPSNIEITKKIFLPMKFEANLCSQCGICEQECPTRNIAVEPSFRFGDDCIFCYNCVRNCETGAITNDILDVIEDMLRLLASEYSETSMSQIFL
jgi:ferredoxin